jgi:hypothetical protein
MRGFREDVISNTRKGHNNAITIVEEDLLGCITMDMIEFHLPRSCNSMFLDRLCSRDTTQIQKQLCITSVAGSQCTIMLVPWDP